MRYIYALIILLLIILVGGLEQEDSCINNQLISSQATDQEVREDYQNCINNKN